MRRGLALATLLALGGSGAASLGAQGVGLSVGAEAPAVTVQDLDGAPVALGRYLGHEPLVLEFWATWCPLCQALEPSLKAAHTRYGRTVRFLAIAVGVNQSPTSIRQHLAAHPLPFPVVYDATGAAVRAYAAPTTSYIVVVDQTGKVTYTGTGAEQDIAAVLAKL